MRKVKIYSTNGSSATIETNVTTLGELKPLLSGYEINYVGMKMMIGETKNEIERDDAVLPETDFKLYLMPEKTKSGFDLEDIENEIIAIKDRLDDLFEMVSDLHSSKRSNKSSVSSNEDAESWNELNALATGKQLPKKVESTTSIRLSRWDD